MNKLEQAFAEAVQASQQGQFSDAETRLQAITQVWPECKEAWYHWAELCQQQGRWNEAVDYYGRVLTLDPEIQEVYLQLGRLAAQQGQFSLAQGYWQHALSINADYVDVYLDQGLLWAEAGEIAHSQRAFLQALRLRAELYAQLCLRVNEHFQQGHLSVVIALSQALIAYKPHAQLFLWQAQAFDRLGETEEAERSLAALTGPGAEQLRGLYVPTQLREAEFAIWEQRLQTLLAEPMCIPSELWADIPHWPAWETLNHTTLVQNWLRSGMKQSLEIPYRQRERQRLLCVFDQGMLPALDVYGGYLQALPRRRWEIRLAARSPQLLNIAGPFESRLHLAEDWLQAAAQLKEWSPDLILWGHPERDALQFALSAQNWAPLQMAWSEQEQMHTLNSASAVMPSEALLLIPVERPYSAHEIQTLAHLLSQFPLCLVAHTRCIADVHAIQAALPRQGTLQLALWQTFTELKFILQSGQGLWLCDERPSAYALQAHACGVPCWQAWPLQPWALSYRGDSTEWAVILQDRLTQALKEKI